MRPTVSPGKRRDLKSGFTRRGVVGMKDDDVAFRTQQDGFAAWAEPTAVCCQQLRAAIFQHRFALVVDIRTGDPPGAAYHGAIRTMRAAATQIEGDEEVIEVSMTHDEGCFYRL